MKKKIPDTMLRFRDVLFLNSHIKTISPEMSNKLHQKISNVNIARTMSLCVIIVIFEAAYIVSDFMSGFWYINPYPCFNRTASFVLAISSVLFFFVFLYIHKQNDKNIKIQNMLVWAYYAIVTFGISLYIFSDFWHGVFSTTIFFAVIIYSIIPIFNIIPSFLCFSSFAAVATCAILTSPVPHVSQRLSNCIFTLYAGFFIATYLRADFIKTFISKSELKCANAELEIQSRIDYLTNLYNRRGLVYYIGENFDNWVWHQAKMGIICLDIDDFKLYNDQFTHPVGDCCLKQVAMCLKETVKRHGGELARTGGEEIIILIPNVATLEDLIEICNEIRSEIAALKITNSKAAGTPYLTISLGGALVDVTSRDGLQKDIDNTDSQLYNAKIGGKDCTSVDGVIYRWYWQGCKPSE